MFTIFYLHEDVYLDSIITFIIFFGPAKFTSRQNIIIWRSDKIDFANGLEIVGLADPPKLPKFLLLKQFTSRNEKTKSAVS